MRASVETLDNLQKKIKRNCPFCNNKDVAVGFETIFSMSVSCKCGAKMVVLTPDRFPEGIKSIEDLDYAVALEAVGKWNSRP